VKTAVLGVIASLLGAHVGGAIVRRLHLGLLGAVAVGWFIGMGFAFAVIAAGLHSAGKP
jgi:hypothetical protein